MIVDEESDPDFSEFVIVSDSGEEIVITEKYFFDGPAYFEVNKYQVN